MKASSRWCRHGVGALSALVFCVSSSFAEAVPPREKEYLPPSQAAQSAQKRYVPGEVIVKLRAEGAVDLSGYSAGTSSRGRSLAATSVDAANIAGVLGKIGVVDVRHLGERAGSSPQGRSLSPARISLSARLAKEQSNLLKVRKAFAKRAKRAVRGTVSPSLANVYVLHLAAGADVEQAVARLRQDSRVEFAHPNRIYSAVPKPVGPGAPAYESYSAQLIRLMEAQRYSTGKGVVLAVVDTGGRYSHAALRDQIWQNPGEIAGNGIDDDGNGYIDDIRGYSFAEIPPYDPENPAAFEEFSQSPDPIDCYGHGTHVAGIAAGAAVRGVSGFRGVAPDARIMLVKALSNDGYGTDESIALALRYATDNGADVINNSWGSGGGARLNTLIGDAARYASSLGVVQIYAAGNERADTADEIPAGLAEVVTVAASNANDAAAFFSNHGSDVALAAPGVDILAPLSSYTPEACAAGVPQQPGSDQFERLSGTSMAAPHVAGVAALLLSRNPKLTVNQVRDLLVRSSDDKGAPGFDLRYGYGRLNALTTVRQAQFPLAVSIRVSSPQERPRILPAQEVVELEGTLTGPAKWYEVSVALKGDSPQWKTLQKRRIARTMRNVKVSWNRKGYAPGEYMVRMRASDDLAAYVMPTGNSTSVARALSERKVSESIASIVIETPEYQNIVDREMACGVTSEGKIVLSQYDFIIDPDYVYDPENPTLPSGHSVTTVSRMDPLTREREVYASELSIGCPLWEGSRMAWFDYRYGEDWSPVSQSFVILDLPAGITREIEVKGQRTHRLETHRGNAWWWEDAKDGSGEPMRLVEVNLATGEMKSTPVLLPNGEIRSVWKIVRSYRQDNRVFFALESDEYTDHPEAWAASSIYVADLSAGTVEAQLVLKGDASARTLFDVMGGEGDLLLVRQTDYPVIPEVGYGLEDYSPRMTLFTLNTRSGKRDVLSQGEVVLSGSMSGGTVYWNGTNDRLRIGMHMMQLRNHRHAWIDVGPDGVQKVFSAQGIGFFEAFDAEIQAKWLPWRLMRWIP